MPKLISWSGFVVIIALFAALCVTACIKPKNNSQEIVPTTGEFSEAEEAFYLKRYETLVQAFKAEADTTTYDTEIKFGETLTPRALKRGEPVTLKSEVLGELVDYAQAAGSDSFIAYEDGRVVSEHYFGDVNKQSFINSKSLAKPLGVIAMGRAIEAGYVDNLDQSVADFIVEWQGTGKANITINHVLSMRTGLLPQGAAFKPDNVLNRAYLHPRHDEVIIHEYPLVNIPGERYDYSNANSELVSVIIARATGMPYQDWLVEQVLKPLGMAGGKVWLNREGGVAHSGCCIGLPSESYLKLAVLILNKGQWDGEAYLSADYITKVTTPSAQNKYAGMALYVGSHYKKYRGAANPDLDVLNGSFHSEPYVDKDLLLFDGNGSQVAYIMPSRNIILMRLGSTPAKGFKWDNAFMPNLVARSLEEWRL